MALNVQSLADLGRKRTFLMSEESHRRSNHVLRSNFRERSLAVAGVAPAIVYARNRRTFDAGVSPEMIASTRELQAASAAFRSGRYSCR